MQIKNELCIWIKLQAIFLFKFTLSLCAWNFDFFSKINISVVTNEKEKANLLKQMRGPQDYKYYGELQHHHERGSFEWKIVGASLLNLLAQYWQEREREREIQHSEHGPTKWQWLSLTSYTVHCNNTCTGKSKFSLHVWCYKMMFVCLKEKKKKFPIGADKLAFI